MTKLLLKITPEYREYVGDDGTLVVELDKALYGCVEAAKLRYDLLTKHIIPQFRSLDAPVWIRSPSCHMWMAYSSLERARATWIC